MNKSIILLFCCVLISTVVSAETVKLATWEYPPYTSKELNGYGFVTEIISAALQKMDIEVEFQFFPWKMGEKLLQQGKIWATFPYAYTDTRAQEFLFSDTITEGAMVFFYYGQSQHVDYELLEDLKDYTFATVKGSAYLPAFDEAGLQKRVNTLDEVSALKKLMSGEADFLVLDEIVGWDLIHTHFPPQHSRFKTLEQAYRKDDSRLMVSKAYPNAEKLLKQFNAALKEVKASDQHITILQKYELLNQPELSHISW